MLTLVAVVAAWLKGGHPERLGVLVTIVVFAVSFQTHELLVDGFHAGDAVVDVLLTGFYLWLALTSDRWWALIMSGTMVLTLLVHVSALAVPEVGPYAAVSARIGLGILSMLTLLGGAGERWLVGESAISDLRRWRPAGRGFIPAANAAS